MKAFFVKHKKLHIWLLADLTLLAAYFLCRRNRAWMNFWVHEITTPFKRGLGKVCYLTEISVMEVMCVLAVLAGAVYVIAAVRALVRAKGHWKSCAYRAIMGAVCIGLTVYAGFSLLWGANFWADSFQEQSGIYAEPVAPEDLLGVTIYLASSIRPQMMWNGTKMGCLPFRGRRFWKMRCMPTMGWNDSFPLWNLTTPA